MLETYSGYSQMSLPAPYTLSIKSWSDMGGGWVKETEYYKSPLVHSYKSLFSQINLFWCHHQRSQKEWIDSRCFGPRYTL